MMQPDLRADLALVRGEPVPADVVQALRDELHAALCEWDAERAMRIDAQELAASWLGLVRGYVACEEPTEALMAAVRRGRP